jgi:hypothetical protein
VTGRAEVWQTIRIATEAIRAGIERGEREEGVRTAQAIVDAANLTIPHGDMSRNVFDESGVLYSMPQWVVCDPGNLFEDDEADENAGETDDDSATQISDDEGDELREAKGKTIEGDMFHIKARLSEVPMGCGNGDVECDVGVSDNVRTCARRILDASSVCSYSFPTSTHHSHIH